jgi:tRNA threonylcarbamoyl adenosine modification protein YeaZ
VNVLALDGALGTFSAAIARDGRVAASLGEPGNAALEHGLTIVDAVFLRARLTHGEIDRLAVGIGPGRFTALRIAVAYAKALAAAWERPLVPIQSFDILEYGRSFQRVLTVVEGRPGVISARYRVTLDPSQGDAELRRASGRIADVLDALRPAGRVDVVGAPEDVLHALAERGIIVRSVEPLVTPAAAAAALAAGTRSPARSLHEIRADYGELPAVTKPRR